MRHCKLGKTDITLSSIIMGTWQTGKRMWTGIDDSDSVRALQAAVDAGITTIDTAEVYGEGHSEKIIGQALAHRRKDITILSKVFCNHYRHDQALEACERSLRNLRTDVIDLYQIHWPPGTFGNEPVPLEETMGALLQLREQGKIRAIGVSNFTAELMAEALSYGRIESLQPPYSLFWRFIEDKEIPFCREHELTVLAYSPLAQGLLTGKFGPDHKFEEGDHRAKNKLFLPDNYQRVQAALTQLRPIAEDKGISLGQLALAWLTNQPQTCAIAGARNADQIVNSAVAGDISLTEKDHEALDKLSRIVTDHLEPAPMMWDF